MPIDPMIKLFIIQGGFNPDQPRDDKGKFAPGGGGSDSSEGGGGSDSSEGGGGSDSSEGGDESTLTKSQVSALRAYTEEGFTDMNEALRNGDELSSEAKENVEALKSAIDSSPEIKETMYRGIGDKEVRRILEENGISEGDEKSYKSADLDTVDIEKGFLSTTKDKNIAGNYTDELEGGKVGIIRIVPSRKRGVDVSAHLKDKTEQEVIFKPLTRIKYKEVIFHGDNYYEIIAELM